MKVRKAHRRSYFVRDVCFGATLNQSIDAVSSAVVRLGLVQSAAGAVDNHDAPAPLVESPGGPLVRNAGRELACGTVTASALTGQGKSSEVSLIGGAAGIAAKLSDDWIPPLGTRREPDHTLSPLAHGPAQGDSGVLLLLLLPHGEFDVGMGVRRLSPMAPGCESTLMDSPGKSGSGPRVF